MVYTAAIDDRFGAGKVTSRIGIHEEANLFTSTSDLFAEVSQRLQQEKIQGHRLRLSPLRRRRERQVKVDNLGRV